MASPKDTRQKDGQNQYQCPHCLDWFDSRGFSSHADNCSDKVDESVETDETPTPEPMSNEETDLEEDEYEEVTSGKQVETDTATCNQCSSILRDADAYARQLRDTAKSGTIQGRKLEREEIQYLQHRADQVGNYYAVCVTCDLAFEKTEL